MTDIVIAMSLSQSGQASLRSLPCLKSRLICLQFYLLIIQPYLPTYFRYAKLLALGSRLMPNSSGVRGY